MDSSAHRALPPAEAPKGEQAGSLQRRLAAALAPDATSRERDALIYALSRPLPPEASPRERADLLLALLEDGQIRALTGSNGRTVGKAATQALLALGYPYALEIPPGAIESSDEARPVGDRLSLGSKLIVGNAAAAAMIFTLVILAVGNSRDLRSLPFVFLGVGACTVLPLFLVRLGRKKKSGVLKILGTAWLGFSAFAVGAICFDAFFRTLSNDDFWNWRDYVRLAFFASGLLCSVVQFVGTYLLHAPERSTSD